MEEIKSKKSAGLGKSALYALAVGQVIGAGVFTVLGSAIAATGPSAWLAYAVAVVLGFITILPFLYVSNVANVKGGLYSSVSGLLDNKIWAGILTWSFVPIAFSFSLFAISLGMYAESMFGVNARIVGIIALTFFYLINLLPIKNMANVQKVMTGLLILTLILFCVFGLPKVNSVPFSFNSGEYFSDGTMGFVKAIVLLFYSTTSYSYVINYCQESKNPRKDMPVAIISSAVTILILYSCVGIVSTGILPIESVANQPLTYVAKEILPTALFILLVVGGVLMALATTLNSQFGSFAQVFLQGAKDGWFPKPLAKRNKFGQPWILMTIAWIIAILPLFLGLDVDEITNNINLMILLVGFIPKIAVFNLPKKFPEACAKSKIFGNKILFYILMSISLLFSLITLILSATALTPIMVIVSVSALAACVLISFIRVKQNKVTIEKSIEPYND